MAIGLPADLKEMIAHGTSTPMDYLKNIISDYFSLFGKPRHEMIFNRKINDTEITLESIAEENQVTRERIRQIYTERYNAISMLLTGKSIRKPSCYIYPEAIKKIFDGIDLSKSIILRSDVAKILGVDLSDKETWGYIDLVMEVKNFTCQEYKGTYFYVPPKTNIPLGKMLRLIHQYLKTNPLPVSINEIAKSTKIMSWFVTDLLPFIQGLQKTNEGLYYLPIAELFSADRAFRVLTEHKEPMHYTDLNEKIGLDRGMSSGYLVRDKRFVNIGKSGRWALKEWDVNKRSLTEVIVKALDMLGRPAYINEVTKCVQQAIPHTTSSYVHSYLIMSPKSFCWTPEGKVCLKSWGLKGTLPKKPHIRAEGVVTEPEFMKKLIDAMGGRELSSKETIALACSLFPDIKKSTISWRIHYTPSLIKRNSEGVTYFKANISYVYPLRRTMPNPKTLRIVKELTAILKKEGSKKRTELICRMIAKGYTRPILYKVIATRPEFSTKVYSKRKTIVSLVK